MNVKRDTVTGIVIQRRRQLDVEAIGESKSRACLPRQHEGVSCRNFLSCTVRVRRLGRSDRIFRIYLVINELRKVYEDVELQLERLTLGYRGLRLFAVPPFTIRLDCSPPASANVERKRVLPLLREAFGVDILVPEHGRCHEGVWHSAAGKLEVWETGVTEIRLAYEDAVVVF